MTVELDMVVDAEPTEAPLGKAIGLCRQRIQVRPVELFEQRSAGDPKPPDRAFVIELAQQLADRRIQFSQAVEAMVAQPAEQPALDDQHRNFDLRLVAWTARPCRQDRGIEMRRHLGVGPIDLRLVKTGLDDRDLGVVRHEQFRRAAERCKSSGMGADPVGQRLGPARLGVSGSRFCSLPLSRPVTSENEPVDLFGQGSGHVDAVAVYLQRAHAGPKFVVG